MIVAIIIRVDRDLEEDEFRSLMISPVSSEARMLARALELLLGHALSEQVGWMELDNILVWTLSQLQSTSPFGSFPHIRI